MTSPTPPSLPPASRDFYDRLITERGVDDATDFSRRTQAERFAVALGLVQADLLHRAYGSCAGASDLAAALSGPADPRRTHIRVLDVGCNVGDFRCYLEKQAVLHKYLGVDLHRPFVDRCNERAGRAAALHGDVLDDAFLAELAAVGPFDYVVASGVFCHTDQATSYPRLLQRLWSLAKLGLVANFLTSLNPGKPGHALSWHPALLLGLVSEACAPESGTPKFSLRHDYLPNDFTIAVYR